MHGTGAVGDSLLMEKMSLPPLLPKMVVFVAHHACQHQKLDVTSPPTAANLWPMPLLLCRPCCWSQSREGKGQEGLSTAQGAILASSASVCGLGHVLAGEEEGGEN